MDMELVNVRSEMSSSLIVRTVIPFFVEHQFSQMTRSYKGQNQFCDLPLGSRKRLSGKKKI